MFGECSVTVAIDRSVAIDLSRLTVVKFRRLEKERLANKYGRLWRNGDLLGMITAHAAAHVNEVIAKACVQKTHVDRDLMTINLLLDSSVDPWEVQRVVKAFLSDRFGIDTSEPLHIGG